MHINVFIRGPDKSMPKDETESLKKKEEKKRNRKDPEDTACKPIWKPNTILDTHNLTNVFSSPNKLDIFKHYSLNSTDLPVPNKFSFACFYDVLNIYV